MLPSDISIFTPFMLSLRVDSMSVSLLDEFEFKGFNLPKKPVDFAGKAEGSCFYIKSDDLFVGN